MSNDADIFRVINTKSIILRYIKEMIELKIPLIISLDEDSDKSLQIFKSTILKIDSANNQLILHQSLPASWEQNVSAGKEAQVKCHLKSGSITFLTSPSYFDQGDKSLYSQLSFPSQIRKKQLRSSFRVSLLKHKTKISVQLSDNTEFFGNARDLSLGGGLCQLDTTIKKKIQLTEHFQTGSILKNCRLKVADYLDITCSAEISHVKKIAENRFQLGLKFIDLEASQINQIRLSINKLERLNITRT